MTERQDHCTICHGAGGRPAVLQDGEDFRISQGWSNCSACGGTGDGGEQRRIEAATEQELEEVVGE